MKVNDVTSSFVEEASASSIRTDRSNVVVAPSSSTYTSSSVANESVVRTSSTFVSVSYTHLTLPTKA